MKNEKKLTQFDNPLILQILFHPRPEQPGFSSKNEFTDLTIPVEDGVSIGGRFYSAGKDKPVILFFHGNGEIVQDYDDLAPFFIKLGANFLPVDYRGYGRSTGRPTVSGMLEDSHKIFSFALKWLRQNGHTGPMVVMGRSLGSASALELAAGEHDQIDGLIIESGFANALFLLKTLGIDPKSLGINNDSFFNNTEKIKKFNGPSLVIHAEYDHIIPFSDGKALFESSPAKSKRFLKIPNADHNTIFYYGMDDYLAEISILIKTLKTP
ncbi:MAG: alpha/beta hydrolase [Spirochaetes bacterium]|jgi:hypothetical protein|nr:alpha/beta hydrolase [Spirochaetota bacterium]